MRGGGGEGKVGKMFRWVGEKCENAGEKKFNHPVHMHQNLASL